jgi:phosphate transport system protein
MERLWEILLSKESLLDEAKDECIRMLDLGKEMFVMVLGAIKHLTSHEVREQVARMDKEVNRQQREIRKKVFEHLAISRGRDLLEGLRITSVVVDLERIGDYSKNIGELVDMLPGQLVFEQYEQRFQEVRSLTLSLFDLTRKAVAESDEDQAREAMRVYDRVSKLCDGTIQDVISGETSGETVQKCYLGLVLMLRYMKRVGGHLKNIASAIVNPFDSIGYRIGAA